ncbi:MAG: hypothetical protein OEW58_02555 [Gammaproteobacteria bacterium]|nr:hypothetical protein [Gammaproteobacteria bacterium]
MDAQEKIAKDYLAYKGYESIEFEPDGNIPPDFLVDGTIAIEVRRLNQNYENEDGETSGLEEDRFPLYNLVNQLLDSYDQQFFGKTYFVYLWFRRPVGSGKVVRNAVKEALDEFSKCPLDKKTKIKINSNLSLNILPASSSKNGKLYLLGGCSDRDSGGWVLSELERNILICSEEKLQKVQRYRSNYSVWWLVLINRLGFEIGNDEKRYLNDGIL